MGMTAEERAVELADELLADRDIDIGAFGFRRVITVIHAAEQEAERRGAEHARAECARIASDAAEEADDFEAAAMARSIEADIRMNAKQQEPA